MKIISVTSARLNTAVIITAGAHKGAQGKLLAGQGEYDVRTRSPALARIELANGLIIETSNYTCGDFWQGELDELAELYSTQYRKPTYKAPEYPQESRLWASVVKQIAGELGAYIPPPRNPQTGEYRQIGKARPNVTLAGRAPYLRGFELVISDTITSSQVYCDIKSLNITIAGEKYTLREFARTYKASKFGKFVFWRIIDVLRKIEKRGKSKIGTNFVSARPLD